MEPVHNRGSTTDSSVDGKKTHKKNKSFNFFTSLFKKNQGVEVSSKDVKKPIFHSISEVREQNNPKTLTSSKIVRLQILTRSSPTAALKNQKNSASKLFKELALAFPNIDASSQQASLTGSQLFLDTEELIANLSDLRKRVSARDSQQTLDEVKKHLSSNAIKALGGSVNYVFKVGEELSDDSLDLSESKMAFVKCARDGNEYCVIMEAAVTKITKLLTLLRFVDSQYFTISPRSGQNLLISDSEPSSQNTSAKSKKDKSASSSRSKKIRSLNLSERFLEGDSKKIPVVISKGVQGYTLGKIYEESKHGKNEVLWNHFIGLFEASSNREELKLLYRTYFIEAAVDSMIIGTSDAHGNNIILAYDGFYHLDQGRSLSNSNNFTVWGDAPRLPYHSAFLKEKDFFTPLTHKDIEGLHAHIQDVLKEQKSIDPFFDHPMQKEQGGLDHLPPGWLYKKSTSKAIHKRLERIKKWTANEMRKAKRNEPTGSLDDLLKEVYPYHSLVTCLYAMTTIVPNYLLTRLPDIEINDHVINDLWQNATANAGKFQDRRNSFNGKIYDVLTLLDQYVELGFDSRELLNMMHEEKKNRASRGKHFFKKMLLQFEKKIKKCHKAGLFGDKIPKGSGSHQVQFQTLAIFNELRKWINISKKKGFDNKDTHFNVDNPESWLEIKRTLEELFKVMAKMGLASESLAEHSHEDPHSLYLSAMWIFENNAVEYFKTVIRVLNKLQSGTELNSIQELKEVKLILCGKAAIDYKDIPKTDLTAWFIQYLYKLCLIGDVPFRTRENLPSFELQEKNGSDFQVKTLDILSQYYTKGYCLKFYPLNWRKLESRFLEAGCSLTYLDPEGEIISNKEIMSAIVIEGKVYFKIKANASYHLVPFMEFFWKLDDMFKGNIKINLHSHENIQFAKRLYPQHYFQSVLMRENIEFFDFDEYHIDPEEFHEIREFVLFFQRVYVIKKHDNFFVYYLDKSGQEDHFEIDFDRVTLSVRMKDYTSTSVDEFCSSLTDQYATKSFYFADVKIDFVNAEHFEIDILHDTIKGKCNMDDLEVEIQNNKMKLHEFKGYLEKKDW